MDFDDEVMEVDLSGNSIQLACAGNSIYRVDDVDAMDISYTYDRVSPVIKIKEEPTEAIKPSVENMIHDDIVISTPVSITNELPARRSKTIIRSTKIKKKLANRKTYSITELSIILTILSLLSLLTYHILKFECSGDLKLDALKTSLVKNVIGQQQAIDVIIESLVESVQAPHSSKLLLIYGGTGVGKTLTISLVLENLHHYANIYHYTMPSFNDILSTDLMLGLRFCPSSLIIVDDLNSTDMHVTEHVKNIIEKGEHLGKQITIILVFNCDTINEQYIKKCDESFNLKLQQAFKDIKALKIHIKFNSLTEEHLRRCIEKEMRTRSLSEAEYENIVKHFNVTIDGCKGVYTKIKGLNYN